MNSPPSNSAENESHPGARIFVFIAGLLFCILGGGAFLAFLDGKGWCAFACAGMSLIGLWFIWAAIWGSNVLIKRLAWGLVDALP